MSARFHLFDGTQAVFEGVICADGPHIKRQGGDSVALGEAELHLNDPIAPGWRLMDNHHIIDLSDLTDADVQALQQEFGLPSRTDPTQPCGPSQFWHSPAFEGLRQWVRQHPGKAAKTVKQHAQRTPGWLEMCDAANTLEDEST